MNWQKLLELSTKELLVILEERGVEVRSHMSSIDMEVAQEVEKLFSEEESGEAGQAPSGEKKPRKASEEGSGEILCEIPQGASISQVADILNISAADAVRALVNRGMMVPANASADDTILEILGDSFGALLVWATPEKGTPKEVEKTPKAVTKVFHGSNLQPPIPHRHRYGACGPRKNHPSGLHPKHQRYRRRGRGDYPAYRSLLHGA